MHKALLVASLALSLSATAAVKTQTVPYTLNGKSYEGFLAWDDAGSASRPGVLVFQEWWGINDHIRETARKLAAQGYVAFAPDLYGKGIRPTTPADAGKLAGGLKKDIPELRARAGAGLEQLKRAPHVDPKRLASVGFCFGGTAALELARSGAPLLGTVSIHGGLSTPVPQDAKNIQGRVLALAGGADPHVPPPEVAAFEKELNDAGVDWQLVVYGGAVHAFTNPAAGSDPSTGMAYNDRAAHRAFDDMKVFLAAVLH